MKRFLGLLIGLGAGVAAASVGCDDDPTSATPTGVGTTTGTSTGGLVEDAGSINGLALINPACGAGDGGTVSQECVTCTETNCAADFEDCFDTDWQTTLSGGVCSTFGQCVMACPCGDNVCFNVCLQQLDAATGDPCRACIVDLVACEVAHCVSECELDLEPDAGSGGSGTGGGTGQGGHGGKGNG